jgi:hypothetical protein
MLLCAVYVRAGTTADVVLLPVGGGRVWMITSHRGHWLEIESFAGWTGARAGRFSGASEWNTGPFQLWLAARSSSHWRIHYVEGQVILPRDAPGGEIATVASYDRARQAGFPGPLSNGDLRWVMLRGWKLNVPMGYPMGLAAVLPLGWVGARLAKRRRRVVRARAGLCARCGYDLRASEERCPECGEGVMIACAGERVGWDSKNDS